MKYKNMKLKYIKDQLAFLRKRKLCRQLLEEINQREQLNPLWGSVLINWIAKFKSFTIDLTGTSDHENRLLQQTLGLLAKQPKHCNNQHLCDVLSTEFEGLYWRAEVLPLTWCSIDEPYTEFKQRLSNVVLDVYVSEEPQVNKQTISAWLINSLNTCQPARIR